jgi:hypothetical protein
MPVWALALSRVDSTDGRDLAKFGRKDQASHNGLKKGVVPCHKYGRENLGKDFAWILRIKKTFDELAKSAPPNAIQCGDIKCRNPKNALSS